MLRPASNDDWSSFCAGVPVPEVWIGYVAEEGGRLLGLGGLWELHGRWWATLKRAPGAKRPKMLLRAARELLDIAGTAEAPVHALADPDIPGSERLLRGLGFEMTDEKYGELGVYRWARK